MEEKVSKQRILIFLSLLCFMGGVGSWFLEPAHHYWLITGPVIHKPEVSEWDKVREEDAPIFLESIKRRREKLLSTGQMNIYTNHALVRELYSLGERITYSEELKKVDYEVYTETFPPFYGKIQTVLSDLTEDRKKYCSAVENSTIESKLWDEDRAHHLLRELRPVETKEYSAMRRDRIAGLLLGLLCGGMLLIIRRGLQTGWTFERLVGAKIARFSSLFALFTFSFAGGPAVAQQLLFKISKAEQSAELALKQDAPDPLSSGDRDGPKLSPEKKPWTTTLWLFGDVTGKQGHDRQFVFQVNSPNKWVVFGQVRRTADSISSGGNITFGRRFQFRKNLDVTTTLGPAFNIDNPKNVRGYNDQIVSFLITNWSTKYFRASSMVKLFLPTDKAVSFGDRHVQTIRGPTVGTPRFLQGFALHFENWHVGGLKTGHWNEGFFGFDANIGEAFGKPKSWLSWFTIFPYVDVCRPQPGHHRLWDIRVQFKRTLALSH
jgi:hypothetical protein